MRWCAVLTVVAAVLLAAPTGLAQQPAASKQAVIPVIQLKGVISESPGSQDLPFDLSGVTGTPLRELIARLREARDDQQVPAIVMMLDSVSLGRAQAEELLAAMAELKAAGKTIHVHADTMSTGGLLVLSGASEISMVPTGYLFITGLYGEQMFLRGLLDKVGIQPDYFTCGSYKSAAELFMRKDPSKESEEMQNWLLDSIFENTVALIADGRGVSPDQVRQWIDDGVFMAEDAQTAGIIQHVQHRQAFEAALRERFGQDVTFDKRYGKKKSGLPDMSSPMGILQFYAEILQPPAPESPDRDAIGIVYLEGPIVDGSGSSSPFGGSIAWSDNIRRALDEAAEDEHIKAVVFRVDSGGGSAVASEVILNASRRVAAGKPLVVSMGNVAGSGGYYVACGTKTIFADPSTITGSIGVVSGKFVTTKMWDHLGINWVPYKRGANAGLLQSGEKFSDSERREMQSYMDAVYEVFKGHVIAVRGDKLTKDIEELAGGRVYTGRQVLDLGLVDKLGGIEDAIAFAAGEAELKDYDVRVVPRPKNFMEMLMEDLSGGENDKSGHLRLSTLQPAGHPLLSLLPALETLDPQRAAALRQLLYHLHILQKERVSLMTPPIVFPDAD